MICSNAGRVRKVQICVCAGLLCGFGVSYPLWLNLRQYPLAPVWPFQPLPRPLDVWLFVGLLALLLAIIVTRRPRWWIAAFLLLALLEAMQDQTRWQPWFYQYTVMLAAIGFAGFERPKSALNICRLVVASVYFWSGLAKLNPSFAANILPFLLAAFTRHSLGHLAYAAGVIEAAIGVGLLFHRTRRVAVLFAAAMHAAILFAIGPFGSDYNPAIWPWNGVMVGLLFGLFWNSVELLPQIVQVESCAFHKFALLVFGIAPLLSFFGWWDSYLSFSLYSGNNDRAVIFFTDSAYDRLNEDLGDYTYVAGPGMNRLEIQEWALGELHVPPYPEARVYRVIARRICAETGNDPGVKIEIEHRLLVSGKRGNSTYTCPGL